MPYHLYHTKFVFLPAPYITNVIEKISGLSFPSHLLFLASASLACLLSHSIAGTFGPADLFLCCCLKLRWLFYFCHELFMPPGLLWHTLFQLHLQHLQAKHSTTNSHGTEQGDHWWQNNCISNGTVLQVLVTQEGIGPCTRDSLQHYAQ